MKENIDETSLTDGVPKKNSQVYTVGKMTFIVTPVYREGIGKPLHEILIDLMINESTNH